MYALILIIGNALIIYYSLIVHQVILFVKYDGTKIYVPKYSVANSGPS